PANPTREGYTFSGWYRTRTAATADRFSFGTPITENLDLYARWTPGVNPPVHTVLFHRNDDSGNLHYAAFVIEGQRAPVPSDPVLAGHLFIGWHTSQAGNTLFNFNTPIMSALNLHADWHADADPYYAVVFRMNDGTYAIHYVAFVPPGSTVLPPTNPLRDDHTFRNWYTAPAATMATRFNFGTAITQNLALYAGWDDGSGPIVHTVLFHRNDNSGDLHYAAFVRHGSLVIAPANPTHEHHTFTGWHRTPTGSTLFDFSTPIESGLSLHANWRDDAETQHLIRFWMNDGTGDNGRGGLVAYAEVPNERTVTPPYPNPTREYTQILMNPVIPQPDEDDEEDDEYYEDDKYDKDDEYYADDDNIIDEDVVTEDDLKDEDAVVDDENDILDDAKTDEDEHIDDDSVIADDAAAEDETEYETEASNDDTYVITQGSGYVSEMLEQAITFEFIENVIIYTFYGWYTCPSNDPQYRFDFGTLITEPLDLYARWERFAAEEIEITHTVLLHRNDGSENLFYAAFVPDGKILADYMPASNPLRAGYEFTGWFRDQEATELFTDAEKALTVGESFELFAGWAPIVIEPEEFTVTFRRNDGSEDVYFTAIVRDGQRVSEPTNPTRIGFTFQGWYTNAAATQRFDFQTAIRSDLNLFAGWAPIVIEPEEFTVTFRRNDGSEEVHFTAIVRDGQRVSEPTNPTRIGFTFQGWYTDAAATQRFDFQTEIRSDLNLFARWRAIVWGGNGGGTQRVVLPELEVPLAQFTQYHNAFIIGFPDRTVRPHATLTRAEVVTMLFRLLDDDYRSRVWSQSNTFADVHASQWFNNAISTMANAGILNRDELFRPNDAVTRAEFASMVARFFDEVEAPETPFNDTNGHWAEDYINRVAQFGWVQGMGDGRFEPDGEMTRAEAAAIINRMLGRIVDSEADLLTGRTRWPDTTNRNAWYYLYMQEATHSTEFERLENGTVRWTEILTNLDWTVLERMDSTPDSITAARAVQQVAEA
ncbi:MAG: InlB B-repeat-containing protein, partial [Oscillospiraceae bacterium]|nr:InlB B-repeat-containing protein [Oscillospiraceae bacterium]